MPISTDEVGQVLERRILDTLFFMLREAYRARLAQEAAQSGLVEQAAAAAVKNGPYAIANCKNAKNAKLAVSENPRGGARRGDRRHRQDAHPHRRSSDRVPGFHQGRRPPAPRGRQDPCVVVADDIKPETTREDVADPEWNRVDLLDANTGRPLDEAGIRQIEGYLDEAGVEFSRAGNAVVYRQSQNEALISTLEEHGHEIGAPKVEFEDLAKEPPATEKQLQYINDLCDQGKISPEQMATFSLGATKRAASELITAAVGSGELGPDIARDAQAAMRREDVGNVEATADYVQSRPNAGDQDRSTPYADQCDPSGAGDANGDGIRDAAQDRDGDGVIDPDDPDGIGEDTRDTQVLCEEKAQESAYIDSLPKSQTANISFQQETR